MRSGSWVCGQMCCNQEPAAPHPARPNDRRCSTPRLQILLGAEAAEPMHCPGGDRVRDSRDGTGNNALSQRGDTAPILAAKSVPPWCKTMKAPLTFTTVANPSPFYQFWPVCNRINPNPYFPTAVEYSCCSGLLLFSQAEKKFMDRRISLKAKLDESSSVMG